MAFGSSHVHSSTRISLAFQSKFRFNSTRVEVKEKIVIEILTAL